MGVSLPVFWGFLGVAAVLPFLNFKGFNFHPYKKPKKDEEERKDVPERTKDSFLVPVVNPVDKVVDAVSDTVVTNNKMKLALVSVLCALAVAVIKVNSDD